MKDSAGPASSAPRRGRKAGPRAWMLLTVLVVCGCGYSDEDLENAYREGHRAGIIWCKRLGPPEVPALDEPLLERWRDGWRQSTSIQCANEAVGVSLAAATDA